MSIRALWWPPGKVAGRYLAPYLATARPSDVAREPLTDLGHRPPGDDEDAADALTLALLIADEDARAARRCGIARTRGGFAPDVRPHTITYGEFMPTIAAFPAETQERLMTPVRDVMRPGVITMAESASLLEAKRAMVRHGVHTILIVSDEDGRPLGWVSADGLLAWLQRDLGALPAAQGITEPARRIEPGATARDALEALLDPAVSHLIVATTAAEAPHGVIGAMDLVDLVTRP